MVQKEEQERKGTLQKLQFCFQLFLHPLPYRQTIGGRRKGGGRGWGGGRGGEGENIERAGRGEDKLRRRLEIGR